MTCPALLLVSPVQALVHGDLPWGAQLIPWLSTTGRCYLCVENEDRISSVRTGGRKERQGHTQSESFGITLLSLAGCFSIVLIQELLLMLP